MKTDHIKVIAFDADDTLWDNQTQFTEVENRYCNILREYASEEETRRSLFKVESSNMPEMGYGTKAFIISLIQNAVEISRQQIPARQISEILHMGMQLLENPATPLSGVTATLQRLQASRRYTLICFTKGELLIQQNKFRRSGLAPYFDTLEIVSDKSREEYLHLCEANHISPSEFMMVGNSFKSDIHPVVELGGYGIYIPYKQMWQYEHLQEYTHERMVKLQKFEDITEILR